MVAAAGGGWRGVAGVLAAARARIDRLEPIEAWEQATSGTALLVDIRCEDVRRETGVVPGSVHIPRTVLEWRVDPDSEWRNPYVLERERRLVLLCSDGFSSSLAAASLVDLGLARAADVIGGFCAWRDACLPLVVPPHARDGAIAGMGGPDR